MQSDAFGFNSGGILIWVMTPLPQVTMTSPTPAGSSRVSNVSIRGLDVTNAAELQIPQSPICNKDDLKTVSVVVSLLVL